MEQKAKVISTDGKTARVQVSRRSMCDGCAKADCGGTCAMGNMFSSGEFEATVINDIGAEAGDTVELETATSTVIGSAALVFVFPIALALISYFIAYAISGLDWVSLVSALGGFVLAFAIVGIWERVYSKKRINIRIVRIIENTEVPAAND